MQRPLSLAVGGILLYRVFHAGVPFLLGALGLADMGRRRHEEGEAKIDQEVEEIAEATSATAKAAGSPAADGAHAAGDTVSSS